jgi:hypothetical protein
MAEEMAIQAVMAEEMAVKRLERSGSNNKRT